MPMKIFGWGKEEEQPNDKKASLILPEEQRENLESDKSILGDDSGAHEQRMQKVAEREVQVAAEDSLKKIHIIQMGRCPVCGEHLSQHLTANICEACGWHKYDSPKSGKVRVHLKGSPDVIEGDHAYVLKEGGCLVIKGDIVFARIPADSYAWVEYVWTDEELEQRKKQFHIVVVVYYLDFVQVLSLWWFDCSPDVECDYSQNCGYTQGDEGGLHAFLSQEDLDSCTLFKLCLVCLKSGVIPWNQGGDVMLHNAVNDLSEERERVLYGELELAVIGKRAVNKGKELGELCICRREQQ